MLEIDQLFKHYGQIAALRGVSLTAEQGHVVCLLGPSGCGKSTLLRIVAGLEQQDSGAIRFAGQVVDATPTHQRGFGLMFQDYALFPHRTVAENVAFGLQMRRAARDATQRRVAELLDLVGLAGYGPRRVDALSGGERQRVALARSLAPAPRLLMLDEPLGALDRALRERLLDDLAGILRRLGQTSLYVTHDQAEAFAIADQVVLMNAGQIEQVGTPEQVYRQPRTRFAARFFGFSNVLAATVLGQVYDLVRVDTALGVLYAKGSAAELLTSIVIRPEAAQLADPGSVGPNRLACTVVDRLFRGGSSRIQVQTAAGPALTFELDAVDMPAPGQPITLQLRPDAISLLAP